MSKFIKFKEKKINGNESIVILNVDNVEKIEFEIDTYFQKPQYHIYINGTKIHSYYLNEKEFEILRKRILKAIGEENIYE